MKSSAKIIFDTNPLEMPLMSITKIAYQEIALARRISPAISKDPNVIRILTLLNKVLQHTADMLDVQDELLDGGFTKAAKQ
jgi:hypothetical protein